MIYVWLLKTFVTLFKIPYLLPQIEGFYQCKQEILSQQEANNNMRAGFDMGEQVSRNKVLSFLSERACLLPTAEQFLDIPYPSRICIYLYHFLQSNWNSNLYHYIKLHICLSFSVSLHRHFFSIILGSTCFAGTFQVCQLTWLIWTKSVKGC